MATQFQEFLSRVVPWPGDQTPGYVNLHYTMTKDGGKPFWSGLPTQTVDDFLARAAWATKQNFIKDIYYCLSLQSEMKTDKNGKLKPVRLQKNALSLKSVWIDVDVKEPPKGYATLPEAVAAIGKFVQDAGLPPPTALVGSGGGVHVYWISDRPLSLDEWSPYADGLKNAALKFGLRCDAGCTVDSARVLRVPGTFNRKVDPPRPVRLLGIKETDYDFKTDLACLPPLAGKARNKPAAESLLTFDTPRSSAFAALRQTDSLQAGIERKIEQPLDPRGLGKECAFFRNALLTGGKDYSQPMWNLTTLLATFLENGHGLAHRMGYKHPGYDKASTEELWERKNKERRDRGLGWPSCSAIYTAGCTDCAACPHFKEGKSPLNFIQRSEASAAVATAGSVNDVPPATNSILPEGFAVDKDGHICKLLHQKADEDDEGPPVPIYVKIFTCKLSMPWAQLGPSALNFTTTTHKGHTGNVSVTHEIIQGGGVELYKALGRQDVKLYPPGKRYLEEFLMAWYTKLHDAQEATQSVPFGWWTPKDGQRHGFVFGGLIMKDDGTQSPAGMGDPNTREAYQPKGEVQPWLDACKLITDQQRPELDAIIAASFAAPLMVVPAEYSALLSAWGTTGVGKSSAIKVGQAVWGHPKKTKEVTASTAKSVIHKMGQLRNLPVYWDEVKNKKAQTQVFDTFFTGSEGIGPGRLTSQIEQRARDDWQTLLIICSNISFVDHIVGEQRTTTAGMYRVLEYYIPKAMPDAPGQISTIDASRITQQLETNYGVVGMKYAAMLGADPKAADAFTLEVCRIFAKKVKAEKEERFWLALCGTLLAGAAYANKFGAEINIDRLSEFLVDVFDKNRKRMVDEAVEGGTKINTEEALTGFLKATVGNTIYTDTFPVGKGKPKPVSLIHEPDRPAPIYVQWAIDDHKLRISRPRFVDYLREKTISAIQIMNGLHDFFGATTAYSVLGGGTKLRSGQEHIITIPVAKGTPLEAQMLVHTPKDEDNVGAE